MLGTLRTYLSMSKTQIIYIVLTGIVTVLLIFGIYLLIMRRQKLESLVEKLFGTRDMEITTGNFIFVKFVGAGMVIVALLLSWKFFL